MGGDNSAEVVVPAAVNALRHYDDIRLILVGDRNVLLEKLEAVNEPYGDRLIVHHASQKVEMGEPPAQAFRMKKDSSMRVAINLVKEGEADAMVVEISRASYYPDTLTTFVNARTSSSTPAKGIPL